MQKALKEFIIQNREMWKAIDPTDSQRLAESLLVHTQLSELLELSKEEENQKACLQADILKLKQQGEEFHKEVNRREFVYKKLLKARRPNILDSEIGRLKLKVLEQELKLISNEISTITQMLKVTKGLPKLSARVKNCTREIRNYVMLIKCLVVLCLLSCLFIFCVYFVKDE